MIASIAWKNVWRNKTRSAVVLIAVTLGTIAGVFVAGLMNGWVAQRINAAIFTEMGHLKIQNPDFLVNEETQFSIKNFENLTHFLDSSVYVSKYSMRSKVIAMATTARGNTGIILKGIDIEKDKQVSDIYKMILPNTGSFFESGSRLPQVLISNKTAEMLKIKNFRITDQVIDSLTVLKIPVNVLSKLKTLKGKRFYTKKSFESSIKIVWNKSEIKNYAPELINTSAYFQPKAKINFSFSKTNGQIGYQSFQVCGIYKTANTMFDQMSAFVKHDDLYKVAGLDSNAFHEISIITASNDFNDIKNFQTKFGETFPDQNLMTWKELAPDAGMLSDFMQIYYYMIMGIIFLALAFGIINTMLMAILERIKELGMLMAIGMKKVQVFNMIMLETIFLTLTGSFLGMLIGGLLIKITGQTGLNFSSVAEGFEAVGWAAIVYPSIEISFFFGVTVLVIIVAILSSIIPARKALKLKPIEALRIE